MLVVIDDHGLAVLDTTSPHPRALWRDLQEPGIAVHDLVRGCGLMSGLVHGPGVSVDLVPQLWTWSLPQMSLRHRSPVDLIAPGSSDALLDMAAAAGTGLLCLHETESGPRLTLIGPAGELRAQTVDPAALAVLASGPAHAVVRQGSGELGLEVLSTFAEPTRAPSWPETVARIRFPEATAIGLRHHDGVVTAHDRGGRIVAVNLVKGQITANLRLRE